ncbi:MAG: NAD(P)H-binding protein [Actinomycetes bacterium]
MHTALIGATGRTGVLVLDELLLRGHKVEALVRGEGRITPGESVTTVQGDSRDRDTLGALVAGVDVVISALGPRSREETLHRDTASALVGAMTDAGVNRFVGISGAGIDVPGDRKSASAKVASSIVRLVGGAVSRDKRREYDVFAASDLDWTLVRPPRLLDGEETGRLEHEAHRSTRSTKIVRPDLATFIVECAEQNLYVRQAPFVATAKR